MDSGNETTSIGKLTPKRKSVYTAEQEVMVDSESTMVYNSTVKLRSLVSARLEYTGQVTGKLYVWEQAGSIVEVDESDSGILLAKRRNNKRCCGNSKDGQALFEILKEQDKIQFP